MSVSSRAALLTTPKTRTATSKKVLISKAQWDAQNIPNGIIFIVPENMPSLNVWKRWHWAKQKRFLDRLTYSIGLLAIRLGKPSFDKARVEVVHYHRIRNRHDPDNYTPKFLLDALRYAGVLIEDNSKVLELPEPKFETDREAWRTEVYIYKI